MGTQGAELFRRSNVAQLHTPSCPSVATPFLGRADTPRQFHVQDSVKGVCAGSCSYPGTERALPDEEFIKGANGACILPGTATDHLATFWGEKFIAGCSADHAMATVTKATAASAATVSTAGPTGAEGSVTGAANEPDHFSTNSSNVTREYNGLACCTAGDSFARFMGITGTNSLDNSNGFGAASGGIASGHTADAVAAGVAPRDSACLWSEKPINGPVLRTNPGAATAKNARLSGWLSGFASKAMMTPSQLRVSGYVL